MLIDSMQLEGCLDMMKEQMEMHIHLHCWSLQYY